MLSQLTVRNFAIIDHLQVEWAEGFNVVTGETGAGKSIIVDAVGALLGDRVGPEIVRTGADRALVEGVFVIPSTPNADLQAVFDEFGLEPEDGALIVSREIAGAGGRGGARVNGRSVPLAVLQALGEQLVDVHGQSQHMALLRVREHLDYLDRYGDLLGHRAEVAAVVAQLRSTRTELARLRSEERQMAREQEILRHEVAEIESAELREEEEDELRTQQTRLRHVERLQQTAQLALAALGGEESDLPVPGAVELLGRAQAACQDGARFDPNLAGEAENLNGALALAEESLRSLRSYLDTADVDPAALETAEARLLAIADLKRKYGDSVTEVLAYLAQAQERLARIENREADLAALEEREAALLAEMAERGAALSQERAATAARLQEAVERELADLRMAGTVFHAEVAWEDDPEGVEVDGRRVAFHPTGLDRVELLIAPNKGEAPRPMARIASGGELARIALALKTILARADTRATLIFDEVDVGVGGRTAPVVGAKLWALAAAGHQVLCVTHMPQVAAFADCHWLVRKRDDDERTRTELAPLDASARKDELAAMLAGEVSTAARKSARELLDRALAHKRDTRAGAPD